MGRHLVLFAVVVLLGSLGMLVGSPGPVPESPSMLIWEAYSRGAVTITQVDLVADGQSVTLGYEVRNTGSADYQVTEFAVLMSPNPRDAFVGATTQDGILTAAAIPADGKVDYGYGDYVAQGKLPPPAWWCTEEFQFVKKGIVVSLGGEIAPFAMETTLGSLIPGLGGTQDQVWLHLRENPTPVIGKLVDDGFWQEIPETAGETLAVELRATNIAIKETLDGLPDPDAPDARVWDVLPAGFTLDPTSVSPSGHTLTTLPDGSTRIAWSTSLPAADVTGMPAGEVPTPYVSRLFSYKMSTPHLTPGRTALPRAEVSANPDDVAEAHSAQPLMDILRVKLPPVAHAGGPYQAVEGETITLTAAASTDPNGDPLQFRWDIDADGTWDTAWSSDPTATATFGDDFTGTVRVEVTDGALMDTAEAPVTIRNVRPAIGDVRLTMSGDLTLRVAGEKWHDVTLEVSQGGTTTSVSVTRMPGSPDEQAATVHDVEIDVTEDVAIRVVYTPEDDPVNGQPNGANPVWVIFDTMGVEIRFHHTFNARHPDTWTWDAVDLLAQVIGLPIEFAAEAFDSGSDDLTFLWEFGDATAESSTYFNDGLAPDPFPSPDGTFPFEASDARTHAYDLPGTYVVRLTVADDDGGSDVAVLPVGVEGPRDFKLAAAGMLEEALLLDPDDPDLRDALGYLYMSLGDNGNASRFGMGGSEVLWAPDGIHVDDAHGGYKGVDVFQYEEESVDKLIAYLENAENAGTGVADAIPAVVELMRDADRYLAAIAIADAESAGGDPALVAVAWDLLAEADAYWETGDLSLIADYVIDKLEESWEKAVGSWG